MARDSTAKRKAGRAKPRSDDRSVQLVALGYPQAELVFGLVGAVGTDLERFQIGLIDQLKHYNYEVDEPLRLSTLIQGAVDFGKRKLASEYRRISTLMTAGTTLRRRASHDIVAALAVLHISQLRKLNAKEKVPEPRAHHAYILNSLKHPEEVNLLQRVYGPGFFLIGVYSPEDARYQHLTQRHGMSDDEAKELIKRDQDEGMEYGQKTRDVFSRADVFVRFDPTENVNKDLGRFLDLIFGDPFKTPLPDEHAMFIAFSNSLRTADLSRQVGAVIATPRGDIVAVGANDVARYDGGLYWPGADDKRDHALGYDSNEIMRNAMLAELAGRLPEYRKRSEREKIQKGKQLFGETSIADITEYGRPVHAEMEAILSCARNGIATRGLTLYCTTFPCHNCAKHIVDSGLHRVVYIEPYPKSRAKELYFDSLSIEAMEAGKVSFEPFVGIGPRRYLELFSMKLGSGYDVKRKKDGLKIQWKRGANKGPRIPALPSSYLQREIVVAEATEQMLEDQ